MNNPIPLQYGPVIYQLEYTPKNKSFKHVYIGRSEDYASDIQILVAKLNAGRHKDAELQRLWGEIGPKGFRVSPILLCDVDNLHAKEYGVHNMLATYKSTFSRIHLLDQEKLKADLSTVSFELEWFKLHGLHVIESASRFAKFRKEITGVGSAEAMKSSNETLSPRRRWVITMAQRLDRLDRARGGF